jgi:hypothetical protein
MHNFLIFNVDKETVQENESSRQMLACHHSLKFSPSRHDVSEIHGGQSSSGPGFSGVAHVLIIILSLFVTRLSLSAEVCSSPDQTAYVTFSVFKFCDSFLTPAFGWSQNNKVSLKRLLKVKPSP